MNIQHKLWIAALAAQLQTAQSDLAAAQAKISAALAALGDK